MKKQKKTTKKASAARRMRGGVPTATNVKAGPTRRAELDHVGAYNFMVEISGVAAGYR